MTNSQMIERLCTMLENALDIIQEQAKVLAMHGITTHAGTLEGKREKLFIQASKEGLRQ